MSRPTNILTKSFDLSQDGIGRGRPDERPSLGIVMLPELIDLGDEVFGALEGASPNGLLADQVKPDLHLVEPGGIGRYK